MDKLNFHGQLKAYGLFNITSINFNNYVRFFAFLNVSNVTTILSDLLFGFVKNKVNDDNKIFYEGKIQIYMTLDSNLLIYSTLPRY